MYLPGDTPRHRCPRQAAARPRCDCATSRPHASPSRCYRPRTRWAEVCSSLTPLGPQRPDYWPFRGTRAMPNREVGLRQRSLPHAKRRRMSVRGTREGRSPDCQRRSCAIIPIGKPCAPPRRRPSQPCHVPEGFRPSPDRRFALYPATTSSHGSSELRHRPPFDRRQTTDFGFNSLAVCLR